MPFLIEITGKHRQTKASATFRFTDLPGGYRTEPTDTPANAYFQPRANSVGTYRRTLFGSGGRTNGAAAVDRGLTELNNNDAQLDEMEAYAFDGYPLSISQIRDGHAPFSSRVLKLTGTMEQIEVSWDEVRCRLRSRLALLDKPLQTVSYAGTTTDGTKVEAEGNEDLKDALKPLLFGAPLNVPAVLANRFKQVYQVGQSFDSIVNVRDKGAKLTAGADFATLALLLAASPPAGGTYTTCKAQGYIRVGGNPAGQITVDAVRGATAAARTAGQVARQILIAAGLVPNVDFFEADITALDAAAPYEVGLWTGTGEMTRLAALSFILDSVGAYISPDRVGVFRIGRFRAPAGTPVKRFSRIEIMEETSAGVQRLATGDEGNGVPAKSITVRHSQNYSVANENELAGTVITSDQAYVTFVKEEWRQEEVKSADIEALHLLAPEIEFETALVKAADAKTIANERLALYGTVRSRFSIPLHVDEAAGIDLDDVISLDIGRFGMNGPKLFVVIGMLENLSESLTTLDVWG